MTCADFLSEVIVLTLQELRKKSMALPKNPGVYLMKNSKNES